MIELQDELNKIKASFEGLRSSLGDEQARLAKLKEETKVWDEKLQQRKSEHAGLISELEAKEFAAIKAGEEAAARIKVGNDQVAELMRIRKEQADQDKELKAREQAIAAREVKNRSWEGEISGREVTVKNLEREWAEKSRRLREAIA
jgi:chromosome segregation ATPase